MRKSPINEEYTDYEEELENLRPSASLALLTLSLMAFTCIYIGIYTGFLEKRKTLLGISSVVLGLLLIASAIFSIRDIIRYFKNRK